MRDTAAYHPRSPPVAFDATLFGEVLGIMIRRVFEFLEGASRDNGIPKSKCGAVVWIQRFGSALNLYPHGHFLVLDGVYAAEDGDPPSFYPVRPPDSKDVAARAERVAGVQQTIATITISAAI